MSIELALRMSRNGRCGGTKLMAESDEERELRKLREEMKSRLPAREQRLHRVDRITARRPGLIRGAARKALQTILE